MSSDVFSEGAHLPPPKCTVAVNTGLSARQGVRECQQPAQCFVKEEIGQEQICQGWEGAERARVMGKMGTASEGGTGGLRQEPCEDYENRAEDVQSKTSRRLAVGRIHCWELRPRGPRETGGVEQEDPT